MVANYVNISNFTIQYPGYKENDACINLVSSYNIIANNVMIGVVNCIYVSSSNYNVIISNNCSNNTVGIHIYNSNNNIFTNNSCLNNDYGIILSYCSNNTFLNNNMSNNFYNFDIRGSSFSHFINNIDTSNIVDEKPIYYLMDQQNKVIDSTMEPGYVGVVNSTNITLKDLKLVKNGQGVLFAYISNL